MSTINDGFKKNILGSKQEDGKIQKVWPSLESH
jgi:hypothetical protein